METKKGNQGGSSSLILKRGREREREREGERKRERERERKRERKFIYSTRNHSQVKLLRWLVL